MGVVSDITALSFPYSFKFEVTSGTQEQRTIIVRLEFKDQFYEHKKKLHVIDSWTVSKSH